MTTLHKYPRTHHIEGSRFQPGDEDLDSVPIGALRGRSLVVEEKIDGSNTGLSFDRDGQPRLQSRGHYLTGGPRERQFDLLKAWVQCHVAALFDALGHRYVMYGEWAYAKHTVFYDELPHYFLEFDVYDSELEVFLSYERRRKLLDGTPVVDVPVLFTGELGELELADLIDRSLFKSDGWLDSLDAAAAAAGQDPVSVRVHTDRSDLMEGLYVKVESGGEVVDRFKFIRADFLQQVAQADTHWLDRPLVSNRLAAGTDLFAP